MGRAPYNNVTQSDGGGRVSAREYFEQVADAVRRHRDAELVLAFGAPRPRTIGGSGFGDGPVVARVISDERALGEMRATEEIIGEALRYIEGLRRVYCRKADAMEMHYIDLMPWADVADEMGRDARTVMRWRDELCDWCDSVGWAHVADGTGTAES